ncbi:MAG: ATP-dependent Clp protease proteolytic subunit [bacterium]|jgi:ATP-dependent Clp protease, protease subunit|nr:ATP-dependent Clp protease proteolytic subunit [bacterium]
MVDEEIFVLEEDEDEDEEEDEEESEGQSSGKEGPSFLGKGLMDARTILISDAVDHKLTAKVTAQLLFLDHQDQEKPIRIFINSPGGSVYDGFAIYDMIRFVRPKVKIISSGLSASAATVIMLAADKENRMAMPNARIMIHQPSMRFQGAAEDVRRTAEEVLKIKKKINQMYADETGQSFEKVQEDTDRDYWMSPEEAIAYGLISRIVRTTDEIDG